MTKKKTVPWEMDLTTNPEHKKKKIRLKTVVISRCTECPHYKNVPWTFNISCKLSDKSFPKGLVEIPVWCKLPDISIKKKGNRKCPQVI
ncbi:MAG: hypothetical protein GY834_10675 [Bacteroidetes bacterium]|nr:hypothetical protein [Bacteroidota bacterium]